MRTRFLTIDFFNSAPSQSLQTLEFLRFPPPQLPPSDLPNIHCFDEISNLNFQLSIERFDVDHALRKFFSNVIPQNINVEIEDYTDAQIFSREDRSSIQRMSSEEETDISFDGTANKNCATVQFEIPELDISLENPCFSNEEKMQSFFEVTDAEVSLDMPNPTLGEEHLLKIQESFFSVDDISLEYHAEQKSDLLEDGCSIQVQIPSKLRTFPLLEVDEISLGIFSYISEENRPLLFESVEPQPWMQKDELMGNAKELFLSMEFDIFEHLLNHCPVPCFETELMCANFVPEMDFINVIEHPVANGQPESHSGLPDGYSILIWIPLTFEQFQFFDLNTSQFSEVFTDVATVSEAESCEQMFGNTITLRTFNDLIVCHELTLGDDSFKSLPVPILSDHEKIQSMQAFVEEILAELKLQPSSTSDGIYLDWHLFEEDIFSCSISASRKMLEIDTYSINSDMNSYDSGMVVLEFVFSDDAPNELNMKERIEVLNIEINVASTGISVDPLCHIEDSSSKLLNDKCQKRVNGEAVLDINAEKAPRFVESMSQFNDLDFFLNPLESTNGNKNPAIKRFANDVGFPVISSKDSIEACVTREMQLQHWDIKLHPEGDPHLIPLLNERSKNLEEQLKSIPIEQKNNMEYMEAPDEVKATFIPLQVACMPSALESKQIGTNMPSIPDAIIIVNTQNVDGEMIISRRSTYQRILAMEKEGVQVVERDLSLPVDIIVSAAVCLVWYDCRNIRKKATASDNSASSVSPCVENIAANVLTSLSFAFSSCILVFEGDISFLSGIMESSDELYASAASLGIDLQVFCSYSSETTGEIILNCIAHASKLTRGLYPKIPESETLAESFLTKFPSVNPLSAHAILSSVGMLVQFLEWSHQHRLSVLQKYLVPDVSMSLLNALCRYGEREDSKSGMTDCSSSVSSAHDSDHCCPKSNPEKRKRKYSVSPDIIDMPTDYFFQFEKPTRSADDIWNTPKVFNSYNSLTLKDQEISDEIEKSSLAFNEKLFGKNQRADVNVMINPTRLPNSCDFQMSKVPKMSYEIKNPSLPVIDKLFGRSKGVHRHLLNKLDGSSYNDSRSLQEGFIGEVIDIDDDDALAGEDFSIAPSIGFRPEMEKENVTGFSETTRKYSSGKRSLPNFPMAAEISSGSDYWSPTRDNGQGLREGIYQYSHTDLINKSTPSKHQQVFFEECSMLNSATNFCKPSFQEKDISHYGRTPLSNAIRSVQPQQGSPWTIEFLDRIREKSRLHQQSLPRDLSSPCFGYRGNSSMVTKRKNPSILDYYKYQKGSTPVHIIKPKVQKKSVQPSSSSKAAKTPIDKRAKRRLTFATNGSKGQSKLI